MSMDMMKLLKEPKIRNITILIIIGLIALIVIPYQLSKMFSSKVPEGALRVVICPECKAKYVTRIKDIDDKADKRNLCKKCGAHLVFMRKCADCDFEFPDVKVDIANNKYKNTMEKFQAVAEAHRCPNCGSLNTFIISVDEFEHPKEKKKEKKDYKKTLRQWGGK